MIKLFRLLIAGIFLLALTSLTQIARGQAFELLHALTVPEGGAPRAALAAGNNGNLYGTASSWGDTNVNPFGFGSIFRVTANGALSNLVSFNNTNGASPRAPLTLGSDGIFYGTTYSGGESNLGTIFKVTTNGGLTTLVSFTNGNGSLPQVGLAQSSSGDFYGSASSGGSNNFGTIFKVTTNGVLTTLSEFNGTNGSSPRGTLTSGTDGQFYGTTYSGGTNDLGTVFKITTNGVFTALVSFTTNSTSGRNPQAKLLLANDGNFYGTTFFGGVSNVGTVFRVTTNGALTTLVSFNVTNGAYPQSGLVQANDGNFYGTTSQGGSTNLGTVFQLTPGGVLTSVHSFTNAANGNTPLAGFALGNDGNLYGTTLSGGNGVGTIFRIAFYSLNLAQSGNDVILSWPTNAVGFKLQSTPNLNSPIAWMDSSNLPVVVADKFVVTNSISGNAQFYRLKK